MRVVIELAEMPDDMPWDMLIMGWLYMEMRAKGIPFTSVKTEESSKLVQAKGPLIGGHG